MKSIPHEKHQRQSRPLIVGAIGLSLVIGAMGYLLLKSGASSPAISQGLFPQTQEQIRQELFDEQVVPAIRQADQANREAAQRCLARIGESFECYRTGVEPFAEDVTSLRTKWGVLRRMPGDWVVSGNSVETLISGKLSRHVFSAEMIHQDIEESLNRFRQDIEVNRNVMLRQVKVATEGISLPRLEQRSTEEFSRQVVAKVRQFSTETATAGVTDLVVIEVISGVGGYAAEQAFGAIIVEIGAAAGGATAGSTAAGGGAGTTLGPVGTALGVAGGVIVGLVIDYWLSQRAQASLCRQLSALIDQIENAAIRGVPGDSTKKTPPQPGLAEMLEKTCVELDRANRAVLHDSILGVKE